MAKGKQMILIYNSVGFLELISETQFNKLISTDTDYKLVGTVRPKYSSRYLTAEQKNSIVESVRTNPGKFHNVPFEKVIEGIKEVVFKNLNT